jgi:hypothetical protein
MMAIKTFGMIPCLKWTNYLPDPVLTLLNKQPWVGFSLTLPFIHPSSSFLHYTGYLFWLNRLWINSISSTIYYICWSHFYAKKRFKNDPPFVYEKLLRMFEDQIIGDGFIGIREKKQDP